MAGASSTACPCGHDLGFHVVDGEFRREPDNCGASTRAQNAAHVLGHLHLDHVRTPVGELARGGRPGAHLRQVDDAEAGEGLRSGDVRHE